MLASQCAVSDTEREQVTGEFRGQTETPDSGGHTIWMEETDQIGSTHQVSDWVMVYA